jgi:transposase-like protein
MTPSPSPSPNFARLLEKKEQSIPGKRSPSASTIAELIKSGKTLAAIGDMYTISRQRVHQILCKGGLSVEQIRSSQGHGVNCPHCQSDRVHSHGATKAGNDRFFCPFCKKTFTVLTQPKAKRKKAMTNAERQRRFMARKKNLSITP